MTSPCIRVCRIEADVCVGCGRTLADIAGWAGLTEAERMAVMARTAGTDGARVPVSGYPENHGVSPDQPALPEDVKSR